MPGSRMLLYLDTNIHEATILGTLADKKALNRRDTKELSDYKPTPVCNAMVPYPGVYRSRSGLYCLWYSLARTTRFDGQVGR
jgi:hypothetical protein